MHEYVQQNPRVRKTYVIRLLILIGHASLSCVQLGVDLRTITTKRLVSKRDWTTCLEYFNHSRLDSQRNRENLYNYVMSMRIFTLIMNKIFIHAPKIMGKAAIASIWIWQPSHTTHVYHILREVDWSEKNNRLRPIRLPYLDLNLLPLPFLCLIITSQKKTESMNGEHQPLHTNMIFSVTHSLELHNAIIVYCASHFLPTMVELVVCTLQNINIFTW